MQFTIMDGTGDSQLHFDRDQLDAAREKFAELTAGGRRAFAVQSGETESGTVVDSFDESADEILFLGPMAGG